VLVSVAAQKRGISPFKYIKTVTRQEFELDVTGWLSSIFYPIGQIASGFAGDDKKKGRPGRLPASSSGGNSEAGQRERRGSRQYSWYRSAQGRQYNLYNLDSRDTQERGRAMNQMKKDFAGQGGAGK
jgi:hypothetical protein